MPFAAARAADDKTISELLGAALTCSLVEQTLATMPVEPLYFRNADLCVAKVPDSAEPRAWFADADCTDSVAYNHVAMQDYCAAAVDPIRLGNALDIDQNSWSLSPGTRIDLGARTLDGVAQPYQQRVVYRQVSTPRGECQLEMRIYKSHPAASEQHSLLALHGGSWSSRSFGYFGLELTVPHYVNQGFVVYAPFYRLLDDEDSTAACNQADFADVVTDAEAALDWVVEHAAQYGSSGNPVVFGQSAGGHLAAALTVNKTELVSAAVLLYPPTDFQDFIQRVQSGAYTNPQGLGILKNVLGTPVAQADLNSPVVVNNSFPQRVTSEAGQWPPMFLIQGMADELVEARQSVRLCDALAGRPLLADDESVATVSELREVRDCSAPLASTASALHLFRDGKHALDVCLDGRFADVCPSGGEASRALVAQSIGEAVAFSEAAARASLTSNEPQVADSGSGSSESFFLVWLLAFLLCRRKQLLTEKCK